MSAPKHTPGEWTVRDEPAMTHRPWVCAGDAHVALVRSDVEQRAADARLIAAAPNLLAALRLMTPEPGFPKCTETCASNDADHTRNYLQDNLCDCGMERIRVDGEAARAAIAKAEGRS